MLQIYESRSFSRYLNLEFVPVPALCAALYIFLANSLHQIKHIKFVLAGFLNQNMNKARAWLSGLVRSSQGTRLTQHGSRI